MNYSLMHFLEYLLCSNVHFVVTSAKRTPEQNKVCNGAPNSQHLIGEAIDIKKMHKRIIHNPIALRM